MSVYAFAYIPESYILQPVDAKIAVSDKKDNLESLWNDLTARKKSDIVKIDNVGSLDPYDMLEE